jgi:pimeloyl-ACP methyl ester carboxylesterase
MASLKIDDIQLAYTDTGMGPPILMIHGYPFNRTLWDEQVEALSSRHRVIAPDLRGFGESDAAPGTATMNLMARDLALLLNHLGIVRAAVCGLSMGGYVALAFYKLTRARRLTLKKENRLVSNKLRRRSARAWPESLTRCCRSCSLRKQSANIRKWSNEFAT